MPTHSLWCLFCQLKPREKNLKLGNAPVCSVCFHHSSGAPRVFHAAGLRDAWASILLNQRSCFDFSRISLVDESATLGIPEIGHTKPIQMFILKWERGETG